MNKYDSLKSFLKKTPGIRALGTKYRQCREVWRINWEQNHYEKTAKKLGVSDNPSLKEIKRQVKHKLKKRNIFVNKKSREDLRLIYASCPIPWDSHNIVPALDKYADVVVYYYSKYGFEFADPDWVNTREAMNAHFIEFVKEAHKKKPVDMVLTYFGGYRVSPRTIETINNMGIVTASFHLDDRLSFRGEMAGGRWTGPVDLCGIYDLNLTQAPESLVKYRSEGGIALLWPLAANQDFFYPREVPFRYDVSFLGSAHGERKPFIKWLRRNGVNVEAFGAGWDNGFVPNEKVPDIFSSSRINLNFGDIGYTRYQCGKCRDFEIPMSGGLMLTTHNEHLAEYFDIDKEVFTFRNRAECLSQIRRLLGDEGLCVRARKLARERSLKEHSWEHRVSFLLEVIGFR
ncbi:MAG: glycosyltransferase [Candidatus Omnitrophota bacterium]